MENNKIVLSELDRERFGVITGKGFITQVDYVKDALNFCADNDVKFLIVRCYVSNIEVAQELEKNGFRIMDTLMYYKHNLQNIPENPNKNIIVRPMESKEAPEVRKIAQDCFDGYYGHYHADPMLNMKDCNDVYTSWVENHCSALDNNNEVAAVTIDNKIVGFCIMRMNTDKEGEAVLGGTHKEHQGKGCYNSMITWMLNWYKKRGCEQMVISTQINNTGVRKVWARLGFEPTYSYYTFHKWF